MRIDLCWLVPLALVAAAPPPAPPAAVQAVPDAATLAAARRLVAASDARTQLRSLVPGIVDAATSQIHALFKANDVPPGLEARIQLILRRHMETLSDVYTPDVMEKMAVAYARHLSAADLDHLADILSDPAMVRLRQQTPAVMAEVLPTLMAAMVPRQVALQKALTQTVIDWLRDHPADKARLVRPIAT